MFKNILLGLGGVGVVGGGGYMIYNATRLGDEGSKVEDETKEGDAGSGTGPLNNGGEGPPSSDSTVPSTEGSGGGNSTK